MKIEGNKLVALLISAGMATTFLAACTINTDELGQGISDLGNAFAGTSEETEKTRETTASLETEPEETTAEPTEETEPEATPTPSATPTPTPSPTPLPKRVDFSEYTEVDLTDIFTVTVEDFGEGAYTDDDEEMLAAFEGNRLVVTDALNETVKDSINIVVDGFYMEAEGVYNRMIAKADAQYKLTGVVETIYGITVDFQYMTNGRVLSVLMYYAVDGTEEDSKSVTDFASFDMLTGQYISFAVISKDASALESALRAGLENSLKTQAAIDEAKNTATTETTETEENGEKEEAAKIPSAAEFEKIYLAPGPATSEGQGNSLATIYGIKDGITYSTVVDINAYSDFLNRYGASVCIL